MLSPSKHSTTGVVLFTTGTLSLSKFVEGLAPASNGSSAQWITAKVCS
jgi:hypothetical protein